MKKLFLILSVLILAATVSQAGVGTIGIVQSFSGIIKFQRGTSQAVPVYKGLELYPDDKLVFRTSALNDLVVLSNECLPGKPTATIRRTDIPSTHSIYWNATTNLIEQIKNGGDGSILIADEEGTLPIPREEVEKE